MSQNTKIEWTDSTWNIVTGCKKVSPACDNCYAKKIAERFRGVENHPFEQGFDVKLWPDRLTLPIKWKKPKKVFVNSMSDLFLDSVPNVFIEKVFNFMTVASLHTFQVLTKRPERMSDWTRQRYQSKKKERNKLEWPSNVWLGVSVETQDYIQRIWHLRKTPALIKFISFEPLLGEIRLSAKQLEGINWIIVGGESGLRARPMKKEWVDKIYEAAKEAKIPFFFKQWGTFNSEGLKVGKKNSGRKYRNDFWNEFPKIVS